MTHTLLKVLMALQHRAFLTTRIQSQALEYGSSAKRNSQEIGQKTKAGISRRQANKGSIDLGTGSQKDQETPGQTLLKRAKGCDTFS